MTPRDRTSGRTPLGPNSDVVSGARALLEAKQRRLQRRFLVEGPLAVAGALKNGSLRFVLSNDPQVLVTYVEQGISTYLVTDAAFSALCETVSPQGVVGVASMPEIDFEQELAANKKVVVCCGISDPGNLGTIIRTAAAAGFDAVVTTTSSADFYNGKTLRASVGTFAEIALCGPISEDELAERLSNRAIISLALTARGDLALFDAEIAVLSKSAHWWIVGSESHGIPARIESLATHTVSIPMAEGVESLNAAVAVSVCLYNSVRVGS